MRNASTVGSKGGKQRTLRWCQLGVAHKLTSSGVDSLSIDEPSWTKRRDPRSTPFFVAYAFMIFAARRSRNAAAMKWE